ncbi:beta strand repeat-containing protein, partial [Bradyrhizobium macuxiense]|uniref:beta strand repeat-containing protein n=1 Tax=Bradyrhizobium macuxiense TaxID=1755647 RepID=UPI000A9F6618
DDHPTANADTATAQDGGSAVTVLTGNVSSVMANDVSGADAPINVTAVVATSNGNLAGTVGTALTGEFGKLTLNADGTFSYTPNHNVLVGSQDVFTYTITDDDGTTSSTTLTITITAGQGPVAGGDSALSVNESALAPNGSGAHLTPDVATTQVSFTAGADDLHVTLNAGALTTLLAGFPNLVWTTSANGQEIVGTQNGVDVVKFDITAGATVAAGTTGQVTVTETLLAAIQGEGSASPDLGTLNVVATDTLNGGSVTDHVTANVVDDKPAILSVQNVVMPNVSQTEAHGSWQPIFGADGLNATAAIGISLGTAPGSETYSFSNNVGTSATGEQINQVTVTPTTGTAYTFYEYTHYDATTHSSEMFAYQTLAGAQTELASSQFFTLTMAADGTYDFHLASNQLQTLVTTNLTTISAGHSGWAEVNGTTSSIGSGTPPPGYDVLIQGGTNYVAASGAFTLGYVNSNNHSFGVNNANFDNGEVVDFKFGTAQTYASFGVYSPASTDSFQVYIWDSSHTHYLTETLAGNASTFIIDTAHWTGTGTNNLAAFNNFVATYGGFSEMDVVNTGTSVGLTSISYNEKVTVTDTTLTFAPTITDGDGDTATSASNLTVTLDGSHTGSGYQLTGTNAVFVASATGADTFTATGTNNTVDFSNASGSVQVNLATHTYGGSASGDTLTGIENLIGSSHNGDVLVGDANNNILIAGLGQATLTGGGGNDIFVLPGSGAAHDTITDFSALADQIFVDIPGGQNLTIGSAQSITAGQFTSSATTGGTENTASAWNESNSANKFFFNNTTQELWYSANGTGSDKVDLAHLSTGIPATANVHIR